MKFYIQINKYKIPLKDFFISYDNSELKVTLLAMQANNVTLQDLEIIETFSLFDQNDNLLYAFDLNAMKLQLLSSSLDVYFKNNIFKRTENILYFVGVNND